MPRKARVAPGGYIYHIMNQSAWRLKMFKTPADCAMFEQVMVEAHENEPLRMLGYCLMPDRWHMVVWPRDDQQLSNFVRWLSVTHAMRWRVAHRSAGDGHLYRSRFRAFPVQKSERLLEVLRYVEGNALVHKQVARAENWQWSSLWARRNGPDEIKSLLCDWPVPRPANWSKLVNRPFAPEILDRLQISEKRDRPYGDDAWVARTALKLGLEHTIRRVGRPTNAELAARG